MSVMRACLVVWLLWIGMLVGCGGGSEQPPVADAGADQRVEVGTTVVLGGASGTGGDGKPLSFAWSLASFPDGSAVRLTNSSAASPSFIPDVEGTYVISLVVNSGGVNSAPDTVIIVATLSEQAQGDRARARAAGLKAILTASTGTIHLEWRDTFPEGSSYRVEAEAADGSISEVETSPGFGVPDAILRSRMIPRVAAAYRVVAVLPGRTVPLQTAGSAERVVDRFTVEPIPTILLDGAEPIAASARFRLDSTRAFDTVTWTLNGLSIGNGVDGPGNPVTRDFSREASGTHRVAARVPIFDGLSTDVQRDVAVSNGLPLLNLDAGYVEARASSGIASVSLSVNGVTVGTLTAPNACSPGPRSDLRCGVFPDVRYDRYYIGFNGSGLPSADHVLVYTVTDLAGQRVQRSSPLTVSNPPVIDLTSPSDGALAYGSVRFRGSFVPDLTGTVIVTASLTTLEPWRNPEQALSFRTIMNTTGTSIDLDADLAGIPPGTYSLSVIARNRGGTVEVKRTLVVTSTQALRHEPIFVGGGFGLASFVAEGDVVAYRDQNDRVLLVNVATGVTVDVGTLRHGLVVSGGRLYSSVWAPGCSNVFGDVCLHEWTLAGEMKPIAQGYSAPSFTLLARGPLVGWAEDAASRSRIQVYDAERSQSTSVEPPGATVVGQSFDFHRADGQLEVVYTALLSPLVDSSPIGVFRWSSRTGTTRQVSAPGTFNGQVMTDGDRVAWWEYREPYSPTDVPRKLLSQPVGGGTTAILSNTVLQSVLRDGILAWIESTPTGLAIKASTSTGLQTLVTGTMPANGVGPGPGNADSTWLFDTSSGFVLYRHGRRFLSWSAATGQSRVVMDTADVRGVQVSGRNAFFTIGRSLYRVPLDR